MAASPQDLKVHLMATNEEFKKLADAHHNYDEKLQQLASKPFLNEEEKIEEIRLKKLKLRLKDEMERIISKARRETSSVAS